MTAPYFYLAGPMDGRPRHGVDDFAAAREALRANGHDVWCPAEHAIADGFDPDTLEGLRTREEYMAACLPAACHAWAVVVLPGWEASAGARAEVAAALAVGSPVMEWPSLRLMPIRVVMDGHTSRDGFTAQIGTAPADLQGTPALGRLADTSADGMWRAAAWPGEVIP